jgi:hypothetical protein
MILLSLQITRDDDNESRDDLIRIRTVEDMPDFVGIKTKFRNNNENIENQFYLPRAAAIDYVNTLIGSLQCDDEPFSSIQLNSAMFPSVMYRVSQLDEDSVRSSIQNIVYSTFNTHVFRE